jgi:curved DNA-binding protein CbpA
MVNPDYYRTLEVEPTADRQAINAAYTWLRHKLQSDEQQLREVNEAYAVLSNPAKRALYDYLRATGDGMLTSEEIMAQRQAEQEQARQRAQRLEQRLRAWRQRANNDRPSSERT